MLERILILGGTGLAREAANILVPRVTNVVTSLAGVTRTPHLPQSEIRVGGFGGVDGFIAYLGGAKMDLVIDATHAFAVQMSAHAHVACANAGVKLVRLEAPAWEQQKKDDWRVVGSVAEVVQALPENANVAVTVGRKEIGAFFARTDLSGIARMIEPPDVAT
ncbi:MAG: precorrin-6A/cobalt-precorrin-6A reductase, partial [Aestuariivirga sp.]